MKATEAKFLEFLRKSPQFAIPIYQRTYSWAEKECRQLWDDIIRTGKSSEISAHFVGSIVYIEKGLYQVTGLSPLLVIDGQQRLTTLTLLLVALAEALEKQTGVNQEPMDGFSPVKIKQYYLVNNLESGERYFKLQLSQTDKETLKTLVDRNKVKSPSSDSHRVMDNIGLFRRWIEDLKLDFIPLCKGLAKLVIVDISLSRDQDNPQLIFESMNSTGRELTQADLIRNFILMGLEPELQSRLYSQYWRPMEVEFGQDAYSAHFDGFMRHYLTVRTGEIPNIRDVYEEFKGYSRVPKVAEAGIEPLVADIEAFSKYFCAMALGKEPYAKLDEAFRDLRELKADVSYPFLLELYADYARGILEKDEYLEAIRLVESYVFRRAVCGIPTNSLNKTFAAFGKYLKKDRYLESIKAYLQRLPSYRRFPTDDEFKLAFARRDLYNFRSRTYWLRKIENYDRKELVAVDEYTIEHIMPQNPNLSSDWKRDLGPEWERIQKTYLHTLGNLTLTRYNPEYSDHSFLRKRDMRWGFGESPLRLNSGLGQRDTWNEASINERAELIAGIALKVWSSPSLPAEVLEAYLPESAPSIYTISDHPHLLSGDMQALFDEFRRQVLALDPCVTEEFLKVYVAYKAETNFVDVVPQVRRLRLSLNMHFSEINDPKRICKDVSNIGRWGNGDVEVGLSSLEELPYVMGLIRQSFERQMGANGDS